MERDRATCLVAEAIAELLCVDPPSVSTIEVWSTATFKELELDSLDRVKMIMILESKLGVEIKSLDLNKLKTVDDVITLLEREYQLCAPTPMPSKIIAP